MKNSIYQINKGINKSIEFKGLRAQYIWYFGAMIVILLILFAILYISGAGTYISMGLIGGTAVFGSMKIFSMSAEYGEHGMMKAIARRRIPKVVKSYTRKNFQTLNMEEDKR